MIAERELDIVVKRVSPHSLRPHPYNEQIYGQESIDDLKEKIQASQWIKTLVVTSSNTIISGHRRWRAAMELGLDVPVEYRMFAGEIDELEALLLENASREKTNEQKANEGATWEEIESERAKERQLATLSQYSSTKNKISNYSSVVEPVPQRKPEKKEKPKSDKKRVPATRDKVASEVGLGSGKNYENAKKAVGAIKTLEQKGKVDEANTLRQVLNGSDQPGNVAAAAKVADMPEEKQTAVLGAIASGQVKTVKAAELEINKAQRDAQAQAAPTKPLVTLVSWENWLPQQPKCDLLITDPPYSTDIEDIETFANAWLPLALSKVKTTGRAYVCIGAYPQELRAYLNVKVPSDLRLLNILVWTYKNTLGPQPHNAYKLNWQAILYYIGLNAPHIDIPIMNEQFAVQEINAPDGRLGDRYHTWQKPDELAERLIRHSTKPGDTVIDCFSGTGTFLLAAHRLGRVAYGCERSEDMLRIAVQRGCEAVNERGSSQIPT